MSKESISDRGKFRCLSEENCARTVRVIRAYSLIFPAPSLQESFFFLWKGPSHSAPGLPDAKLILQKLPPVGKSFLLINTPFVLLIYLDLKQNSPWWIQGEGVQNCSKYSIPYSPCFKHAYFGISLRFGSYFLWRSFEAPHPASRMQGWY